MKLRALLAVIILCSACRYIKLPPEVLECWEDPQACSGATPTPTAAPSPAPSPEPTLAPTASPSPVPVPTGTPSPSPSPRPTSVQPNPPCDPTPPPVAVKPLTVGSCPRGFHALDTASGRLCLTNWACENPEARNCRDGNISSFNNGHVQVTQEGDGSGCPAGFIWDGHSGSPCSDAWCRPTRDGLSILELAEDNDQPWKRMGTCAPRPCEVPTATPGPPGPTPIPPSGDYQPPESWFAPGDHCHGAWLQPDGEVVCLVDSTIRPICDLDHIDNWNTICQGRSTDPDYSSPAGAQRWIISGADDLGPNPSNYAQRKIKGRQGALVVVQVCPQPDFRTADGYRIPVRGTGCGERQFTLPTE